MIRRESIPWWSPAALLLVVVLIAVIITAMNHGYPWTLAPEQEASDPAARVVRVSPSEFFTGDLKRLEPHLNLTASGCVKLEAPGPELFIGIEIELWQAGKARLMGSCTTLVKEPDVVSFSIRELTDAKDKRQFLFIGAVSAQERGSSGPTTMDAPERGSYSWSHTEKISEPRELKEDEKVAVWAYVIPENEPGLPFTHIQGVNEAAKAAQWALVVKVWWERTKDHYDPTPHLP